jgi:hypothetical protein
MLANGHNIDLKGRQLVKHSTQSHVGEGTAGLNGKSQRELDEKSTAGSLTKQRERLLRLREIVLKQIHQLTAEACEENSDLQHAPG